MINDFVFWINGFVTVVNLVWLIAIRKGYKLKPNIAINAVFQMLLPGLAVIMLTIIEAFFEVLDMIWITVFTFLNGLLLLGVFLLFNFSYFWYKGKYAQGPERFIIHNFMNCEPDGAPVNTFTSKFKQRADFVKLVDNNLYTLLNLAANDFLAEIIYNYEQKHKKTFNLNGINTIEPKSKPKKTPKSEDPVIDSEKAKEMSKLIEEQAKREAREMKKATFLAILQEVFQDWYFHILYYKWDYLAPLTEETLSGYTKAYILSTQADLPIILNMNCALLFPENESEKKMTALFCLEGPRDELTLSRMNTLSSELDSFVKPWPKIFEIERIRRERDWWYALANGLLKGDDKILKYAITLKTRRSRNMPEAEGEQILKEARKRFEEQLEMPT